MCEKKIVIWGTSVKKIADEAQLLAIMTIVKQQIENPYLVIITAYQEEVEALLGKMKIKGKAVRLVHFFRLLAVYLAQNGYSLLAVLFMKIPSKC